MEKVFKNRKLAYVLIGILCALQLTQSIANWVGGGFNGGSLILCILMLGLLIVVGVGIAKENKLLTIISGVSILSVVIYVWVSSYSGLIQKWIDGKVATNGLISGICASFGILFLVANFVFIILKAFKVNKDLKTINTVFSIIATILFLVAALAPIVGGELANPQHETWQKTYSIGRDFGALVFALLIPCVWYQVDIKE